MSQHIITLVAVFATRAERIYEMLGGMNPQLPCEGELPPTLVADTVAWLTACQTNPQVSCSGDPIPKQGQYWGVFFSSTCGVATAQDALLLSGGKLELDRFGVRVTYVGRTHC